MPQFFIDRPVFAWVIAILITVGGLLAIFRLPAAAYPNIAPPQISISATYPGANADTVEQAVTQVIEQQLTGINNLLYFTSSSSSNGESSITLTFEPGTDPDIAAVQTQNRATLAEPRLPTEVTQQGVTVSKENAGFLVAIGIRSEDDAFSSQALNNLLAARVLDPIRRIQGVGSANQFGSEYAMRIWLDPDKLHAYSMAPDDVLDQVRNQNVQFASGAIGEQPAPADQQFTAPVIGGRSFHCARAVREHHPACRSQRHYGAPQGCGARRARPQRLRLRCTPERQARRSVRCAAPSRCERARGGAQRQSQDGTSCSRASRRASSGSSRSIRRLSSRTRSRK